MRGILRLLAQTVGQLWREQPGDATAIHLHHIDPGNGRVRLEIATTLGLQALVPAIQADVARTTDEDGKALAQQLDAGEFAGLAPYGSLMARTVLLHSLAFNETLKGLSRLELNYSLGGHKLLLVEGAVLRRLHTEKVRLAKLRKEKFRRDRLSEELALGMGLLFKLLAPMRNVTAIDNCARGIDAMAREEAAYWLGMASHAPQKTPPGAGGFAPAALC